MKRRKPRWPLEVDGIKYSRDEVIVVVREHARQAEIRWTEALREAVEEAEKSLVAAKEAQVPAAVEAATTDA
jgi:predicted translin family RNA/ssDNA-binding protein